MGENIGNKKMTLLRIEPMHGDLTTLHNILSIQSKDAQKTQRVSLGCGLVALMTSAAMFAPCVLLMAHSAHSPHLQFNIPDKAHLWANSMQLRDAIDQSQFRDSECIHFDLASPTSKAIFTRPENRPRIDSNPIRRIPSPAQRRGSDPLMASQRGWIMAIRKVAGAKIGVVHEFRALQQVVLYDISFGARAGAYRNKLARLPSSVFRGGSVVLDWHNGNYNARLPGPGLGGIEIRAGAHAAIAIARRKEEERRKKKKEVRKKKEEEGGGVSMTVASESTQKVKCMHMHRWEWPSAQSKSWHSRIRRGRRSSSGRIEDRKPPVSGSVGSTTSTLNLLRCRLNGIMIVLASALLIRHDAERITITTTSPSPSVTEFSLFDANHGPPRALFLRPAPPRVRYDAHADWEAGTVRGDAAGRGKKQKCGAGEEGTPVGGEGRRGGGVSGAPTQRRRRDGTGGAEFAGPRLDRMSCKDSELNTTGRGVASSPPALQDLQAGQRSEAKVEGRRSKQRWRTQARKANDAGFGFEYNYLVSLLPRFSSSLVLSPTTTTAMQVDASRAPPFSLLEFGDLVSAALASPDPIRPLSAASPSLFSLTLPPRETDTRSVTTNVTSRRRVRTLLTKFKKRASSAFAFVALYAPSTRPLSRPKSPAYRIPELRLSVSASTAHLASSSPSASATVADADDADDAEAEADARFAPTLPLVMQYERAYGKSVPELPLRGYPSYSRLHSASSSPSTSTSSCSCSSSGSSYPTTPTALSTVSESSSSASECEDGRSRWSASVCSGDESASASASPPADEDAFVVPPPTTHVLRRRTSTRARLARALLPPPKPVPSLPLPPLPPIPPMPTMPTKYATFSASSNSNSRALIPSFSSNSSAAAAPPSLARAPPLRSTKSLAPAPGPPALARPKTPTPGSSASLRRGRSAQRQRERQSLLDAFPVPPAFTPPSPVKEIGRAEERGREREDGAKPSAAAVVLVLGVAREVEVDTLGGARESAREDGADPRPRRRAGSPFPFARAPNPSRLEGSRFAFGVDSGEGGDSDAGGSESGDSSEPEEEDGDASEEDAGEEDGEDEVFHSACSGA
ncbi:hypothetical protein C8F04DRAFT_1231844 [Mycena alexandri]|uniref:Uncharacterized protein n=1 Tax=Mycena alexandri TaxID=1745969 RepID=A0AAD6X8C5_9AGAR|nr:hypothetical protein C8F04DRAFT_1231844 [Mycena alexandri]